MESCDILLIAGDILPDDNQEGWFENTFTEWLEKVPASEVVFIGGNHDFFFSSDKFARGRDIKSKKVIYLEDSGHNFRGIKIWGTPWVENLPQWAFSGEKDENRSNFEKIPEGVDIVLSHGPIKGVHDRAQNQNLGSSSLGGQIQRVAPSLFVSGHIHEEAGKRSDLGNTVFINAGLSDTNPEPIKIKATRKGDRLLIAKDD